MFNIAMFNMNYMIYFFYKLILNSVYLILSYPIHYFAI